MNTLLARAAIRFTDAAGERCGALPRVMDKAGDGDSPRALSLMPLMPAETGVAVDREAFEALERYADDEDILVEGMLAVPLWLFGGTQGIPY